MPLESTLYFAGNGAPSVGMYPHKASAGFMAQLYISDSHTFPYSGKVVSWSYYMTTTNAALFAGIWRKVDASSFKLIDKVQLPTDHIGYTTHVLSTPMYVQVGDHIGYHSKRGFKEGVSYCPGYDSLPQCNCNLPRKSIMIRKKNVDFPTGQIVTFSMSDDIVHRAGAVMANLEP